MTFKQVSLALTALVLCSASARAETVAASPHLVVTYLEVPAGKTGDLIAHLKAAASPLEILGELGRTNRVLVIEHLDATTEEAAGVAPFASAVAGDIEAPADRRVNNPAVLRVPASLPAGAFHVVMHLDAVPTNAAQALEIIRSQESAVLAAPGGLGFELGIQSNHQNHFAVHEVWASRQAYEAYTATAAGMTFRRQLAPVEGAPFDDRFYAEVR